MKEILELAKQWVVEIGNYQIEMLNDKNYEIYSKSSAIDLVTTVDIESEKKFRSKIETLFPKHSILGEEGGLIKKSSDYTWIIDPLDGTVNYAHGYPLFCSSVALKYKEETQLGIVYAPMMNMEFCAIKGEGSYLNGQKIKVSETKEMKDALLSTGFPYTRLINNPNLKIFNNIVNKVTGIRRQGSAALDLCMVASGVFDGYWELLSNEWDVAAGILIVDEAGGTAIFLGDEDNRPIISGNSYIFEQLKSEILNEKEI